MVAKCDQGYLCTICGKAVESLEESELYLRYVAGWVDAELLHTTPDRHLRCSPAIAQFIVDDRFEPVTCHGEFAKENLDPQTVQQREQLLTRAWRRLLEVKGSSLPIVDYPV